MTILDKFRAFVQAQPADRTYNYISPDECALGLFAQSLGFPARDWEGELSTASHKLMEAYPRIKGGWDHGAAVPRNLRPALLAEPWTFGALAERLK